MRPARGPVAPGLAPGLAAGLAALGLFGCEALQLGAALDAGPGGGGGTPPEQRVAARTLEPGRCPGSGLVPDVSGIFVFAFETVSTVSGGNLAGVQTEAVTRYGIAQLCQTDDRVDAALLVCTLDQGSLRDDSGTCAAQLPTVQLLASLPGVRLQGRVDLATQTVSLPGFSERWGIGEGANVPAEGSGTDGLVDQDADGDPGISLYGSGAVPTVSWAARLTRADLALQVISPTSLGGRTDSTTTQAILGGSAERLLRGRARSPAPGTAIFVRADGVDGAGLVDQNRDGAVTCAEMAPWIGAALPLPREAACP